MEPKADAIPAGGLLAGLAPGAATTDRIAWVKLSLILLPLKAPISDAKVLTGRQKPLTEVAMLFAEIESERGHQGIGFSYSKRAGGYGLYAHAKEIAPQPDRRGSQRHRTDLGQAGLGRRVGRPQRACDAGDRGVRRCAVGHEGQARRPAARQAAWRAARFGALLQYFGRVPVDADRPACRELRSLDRGRDRRPQDQGRAARSDDRPRAGWRRCARPSAAACR